MTKTIIGISDGQIVEHGENLLINLDFADESFEQVKVPAVSIAKIVQTLMHFASICEKMKVVRASQPHDLASPWRATGIQVGRSMADQAISVCFQTAEKVPIVLTMPEEGVRATIQQLQAAIEKPARDRRS